MTDRHKVVLFLAFAATVIRLMETTIRFPSYDVSVFMVTIPEHFNIRFQLKPDNVIVEKNSKSHFIP